MICPKCKETLIKDNNRYVCINNHSYDISKYGYVNLLLSKPFAGDNSELVQSRFNFLNKGFYDLLVEKIRQLLLDNCSINSCVLDCGCGIGYYSNKLSSSFNMCGIDISKEAITRASKLSKSIEFVVASNQNIPYENKRFDAIINIFSPCFEDEYARVLKDNGIIVLVLPSSNHLFEIKEVLYDSPYLNKEIDNPLNLNLLKKENLTYSITLDNKDLNDLVSMTPYLYKTSLNNLNKLKKVTSLEVTCSFDIFISNKLH